MRILILNPPHESIGSRMPGEMLPPLGLLAIGGPLIDDGHDVRLIDGDVKNLAPAVILDQAIAHAPDAVLIGHNGSTSAHPTIVLMLHGLRRLFPQAWIIYGGVYPTYHWRECLDECPEVDVIVYGTVCLDAIWRVDELDRVLVVVSSHMNRDWRVVLI